jgi:hypothetical protein
MHLGGRVYIHWRLLSSQELWECMIFRRAFGIRSDWFLGYTWVNQLTMWVYVFEPHNTLLPAHARMSFVMKVTQVKSDGDVNEEDDGEEWNS